MQLGNFSPFPVICHCNGHTLSQGNIAWDSPNLKELSDRIPDIDNTRKLKIDFLSFAKVLLIVDGDVMNTRASSFFCTEKKRERKEEKTLYTQRNGMAHDVVVSRSITKHPPTSVSERPNRIVLPLKVSSPVVLHQNEFDSGIIINNIYGPVTTRVYT